METVGQPHAWAALPPGKSFQCPLKKRGFAEEENFFPLLGIDSRFFRRPAGSVTVRSALTRLFRRGA